MKLSRETIGRTLGVSLLAGALLGQLAPAPSAVQAQIAPWPPPGAQPQCAGPHSDWPSACQLGSPDANGTTAAGTLADINDKVTWVFNVPPGARKSVHLTLQDIWSDFYIDLWGRDPTNPIIHKSVFIKASKTFESRKLQFVKPQIIIEQLDPGPYLVAIYPAQDAPDPVAYDPQHPGYTLWVSLGPPICTLAAKDNFQVGITVEPANITQFSLLSMNAFIDPPFSDLFDFGWAVDGKPVMPGARQTIQFPATAPGPGPHQVTVSVKGARQYPDPDAPFVPLNGDVMTTPPCQFGVGIASGPVGAPQPPPAAQPGGGPPAPGGQPGGGAPKTK